jgi:membrane-bound serine protease (ClpP class)
VKAFALFVVTLATALCAAGGAWADEARPGVSVIKVEGAIGPATATYISRAIEEAFAKGSQCLVIKLDTPGGLLDTTKEIVREFLAAPVPVVVYVEPEGAGAISAGLFITLAAHVAAMAPATNIGAAHPVTPGREMDSVMKEKIVSYAVSYIETIAARRDRNVEWAKAAVRESASITSERALELNVIDLVAKDLPELLRKIDGRQIEGRTLRTADAEVVEIEMRLRERVFQMLWRPEVMMILMLIAIYGIIGELSNPGAIIPGMVGAIAFILLLYMAAALPINVAGFALIGLAIVLFIIEVFTPTYGVLTAGGIVAFVLGALMLFDHPDAAFQLSLVWVIPAAVVTALFFAFVVGAGLRAQSLPVRAGRETLIGKTVPALTRIDQQRGRVFVEGEYWSAVSDGPVEEGQLVEIVGIEGLTLKVKPKTS